MSSPIRVLQVVTHMNRGGLETMLMNYYRHIDREKVQFDFLTHRDYDGDYGKEIKSLGGKIYHLPVLNPFSGSYKKALNEFFNKHHEYKIVHVHQDCMSSVILEVAKKQGVPVRIAHSHSSNQDKNIKYPIKLYYKAKISKYATNLMACGEAAGKWMFGGMSFTVLNNAIDTSAYKYNPEIHNEQRSKYGINNKEILIGHIGRFSPPKNHTFLIDIFNSVQKEIPAKLMLVGEGKLKNQIEKKVQDLGIADKVIFTGLRTDVENLLQAMDLFLFPSLYEGLPVTMIEAQASGLPCLISDKVSMECKVTSNVQQIPLSSSLEEWTEMVIKKVKKNERCSDISKIKDAGFDIEENARWLQKYYLRLDKK
ncbi:glycosyltransferase family 1 protein [Dorea formicigenerans]|uniref:glycosyltransferase family 1 protein n=1 Tax=Dorea formicigenerans TaxID=39486 RepID=UPI0015707FBE|nr:glycosyltransferase family 1 protein [Dorea formicigenerans]